MKRQDKTRQDKIRQDKTRRQDKTIEIRQENTRHKRQDKTRRQDKTQTTPVPTFKIQKRPTFEIRGLGAIAFFVFPRMDMYTFLVIEPIE
jgi:hypothetical protein